MKKKKQEFIILNYKHRLHPTKKQNQLLSQEMFIANQVYNITLNILENERKEFNNYKSHLDNMNAFFNTKIKLKRKPISDTKLDQKIKSILKNRNLKGELDTRQQERKIAKKAYFDGIKGEKGFAKFHRYNSNNGAFSGVNARTDLGNNWVKLSARIGYIKMKRERKFPENSILKSVRIKKTNGKYYAIFSIQLDKKLVKPEDFSKTKKILGMDTNNGHLDFSDETSINYPRQLTYKEINSKIKVGKGKKTKNQKRLTKLKNELESIEKLQKKQSKRIEKAKKTKTKLGVNYKKDRLKIAKKQEKIKNRRKNDLDKVSNEVLSKAFDALFLEDLSVKQMTKAKKTNEISNGMGKEKDKSMRKNILNHSYSTLHSMLSYKAMLMDRYVGFVDPAYTTQECSNCGKRNKLSLADRIYSCSCGLKIDRDYNSSLNIAYRGKLFFEELNSSSLALLV